MTRLRAKLNSTRGATLIIALVFMLLCVTTSAIILTAAASSMGRLSPTRAEDQASLTVSSAAKLLRDGIAGESYVTTTTVYTGGSCGDAAHADGTSTAATLPTGDFAALLTALYENGAHAPVTISADGMTDVTAEFTVDASRSITITLDAAEGAHYKMLVRIPAESTTDTSSAVTRHAYDTNGAEAICEWTLTTTVTAVTWGEGTIEKGAE